MTNSKPPISTLGVYETLAQMTQLNQDGVLVTVVQTHLSTPRHEGSKMVIHADGTVTGSIGGGNSEKRVLEEAQLVFQDRQCRRLQLNLAKGLGVCGGSMEVFLEPVLESASFVVIGAGHVGSAMVQVGSVLPFHFTLIDDRPEFLNTWNNNPGVKTILSEPAEIIENLSIQPGSALLLASRNHELDAAYLQAILEMELNSGVEFKYLGLLGSRSKALKLRKMVADLDQDYSRRMAMVSTPAGLDMAAETPVEIALSIFAEAQSILRGVEYITNENNEKIGLPLHCARKPKTNSKPNE
ncbi:MAG: hypothetical protein GY780_08285 [bacterium]|nr:hypothetical protein [bacterium]